MLTVARAAHRVTKRGLQALEASERKKNTKEVWKAAMRAAKAVEMKSNLIVADIAESMLRNSMVAEVAKLKEIKDLFEGKVQRIIQVFELISLLQETIKDHHLSDDAEGLD